MSNHPLGEQAATALFPHWARSPKPGSRLPRLTPDRVSGLELRSVYVALLCDDAGVTREPASTMADSLALGCTACTCPASVSHLVTPP